MIYRRPLTSDELYHWGKGTTSKNHKYIDKIGNRYFYTMEELQAYKQGVTNKVGQTGMKLRSALTNGINNYKNSVSRAVKTGQSWRQKAGHSFDQSRQEAINRIGGAKDRVAKALNNYTRRRNLDKVHAQRRKDDYKAAESRWRQTSNNFLNKFSDPRISGHETMEAMSINDTAHNNYNAAKNRYKKYKRVNRKVELPKNAATSNGDKKTVTNTTINGSGAAHNNPNNGIDAAQHYSNRQQEESRVSNRAKTNKVESRKLAANNKRASEMRGNATRLTNEISKGNSRRSKYYNTAFEKAASANKNIADNQAYNQAYEQAMADYANASNLEMMNGLPGAYGSGGHAARANEYAQKANSTRYQAIRNASDSDKAVERGNMEYGRSNSRLRQARSNAVQEMSKARDETRQYLKKKKKRSGR